MINLKKIRKEKQFTQEQIAKLLGVTKSQVSHYEREHSLLNSDQIKKICNALNCTSDYLLGLIDDENKEDR